MAKSEHYKKWLNEDGDDSILGGDLGEEFLEDEIYGVVKKGGKIIEVTLITIGRIESSLKDEKETIKIECSNCNGTGIIKLFAKFTSKSIQACPICESKGYIYGHLYNGDNMNNKSKSASQT